MSNEFFLNVGKNHLLATLQVKLSLVDQIKSAQIEDSYLKRMKEKVESRVNTQFVIKKDGMLMIGDRMCVSNIGELRRQIMNEAHTAPYMMHPKSSKMYSGFEVILLVANYEKGCGRICGRMLNMSVSKN